jgi:isocitrate/isopropylmalate dehydrogenase
MMLDQLGLAQSAERIDRAMERTLTSGKIMSLSTSSGIKTSEYTDELMTHLG